MAMEADILKVTSSSSRNMAEAQRTDEIGQDEKGDEQKTDDEMKENKEGKHSKKSVEGKVVADAKSKPDSAKVKEREDRVKQVKGKQEEERRKKLEELRDAQKHAQEFRDRQQQERRKRIEDMKKRDEERRAAVEERRRKVLDGEKTRRETLLKKSSARDMNMRNRRSGAFFAFGSSTSRNLYGDTLDSSKRAFSTANISMSHGAPGGDVQDNEKLSRRAKSAWHIPSNSPSKSLSASRIRQSAMHGKSPEFSSPTKRLSVSTTALYKKRSNEFSDSTSSRSIVDNKNQRRSLGPDIKPLKADIQRSIDRLAQPKATVKTSDPNETVSPKPSALVKPQPKVVTERLFERLAQPKTPTAVPTSKSETIPRNRPPSPAKKEGAGRQTPPRRESNPSELFDRLATPKVKADKVSSGASPAEPVIKKVPIVKVTPTRDMSVKKTEVHGKNKGVSGVLVEAHTTPGKENKAPSSRLASKPKENSLPNAASPDKEEEVAAGKDLGAGDAGVDKDDITKIKKQNKTPAGILKKKPGDSPREQKGSPPVTFAPEADQKRIAKESAEDEYKQKMAERRRQAREDAERKAEEERLKNEQEMREEEERIRREQEEQRLMEEEQARLAEESQRAEQERLEKAIEAEEQRKKDETERLEMERLQKEEADKKAKEEAERKEREKQEKLKKEEEERMDRKRRLEMIMKRVKTDSPETTKSDSRSENVSPITVSNGSHDSSHNDSGDEDAPKFKSPLLQSLMGKRRATSPARDSSPRGTSPAKDVESPKVDLTENKATTGDDTLTVFGVTMTESTDDAVEDKQDDVLVKSDASMTLSVTSDVVMKELEANDDEKDLDTTDEGRFDLKTVIGSLVSDNTEGVPVTTNGIGEDLVLEQSTDSQSKVFHTSPEGSMSESSSGITSPVNGESQQTHQEEHLTHDDGQFEQLIDLSVTNKAVIQDDLNDDVMNSNNNVGTNGTICPPIIAFEENTQVRKQDNITDLLS